MSNDKKAIVVGACASCRTGNHDECSKAQCPCEMVGHSPSMEAGDVKVLLAFTMNGHNFAVSVAKHPKQEAENGDEELCDDVRYTIAGQRVHRLDFEACVKLAFQLSSVASQQSPLMPGTFFPGQKAR